MIAKREIWNYSDHGQVWTGKYRNSHNLLHWHPDCELICPAQGALDVFCIGRSYTLEVGQALFIDSEQVHYMHATQPNTVLAVLIFNYNIIRFFAEPYTLSRPVFSDRYGVEQTYEKIRAVLAAKPPFYGAEACCEIERLMIEIFRGEPLAAKETKYDKATIAFKQLLEEINMRYRDLTFEEAAAFMNMSPSYFSRYFRKTAGVTFSRQLNCVRTDEAVRMLQSKPDMSVTQVADACGFGTIRNFNRIFKELTGFAPRDLPDNFILGDRFSYPSDRAFDPTLRDCELIESSNGKTQ